MTKKDILLASVVVGTLLGVLWFARTTVIDHDTRMKQAQEQRKETVCPSFLSIARSSRDTLIVMRNEPLCNRYVLDNLK